MTPLTRPETGRQEAFRHVNRGAFGLDAEVFERVQDKICRIGAPLDNGNGRPSGER